MIGEGLKQTVGLMVSFGLILGPLIFLSVLLNLRDRRQSGVLHAVLDQVGSRDLRGRVSVQVRSGVFRRRSVVNVHILGGSPSELWETMTRVARCLSPLDRLQLTGQTDGLVPATLTAQRTTGRPLPRPSRPTLTTS